ncbi:MAG: hypothetical protein KAU31_02400 [Spirochaetaceae bacterium]|nr:hypothetical protein [Spirochaetaceae bacterium]
MRSIPERQLEIVYGQLARTAGFRGFRPRFLLRVSVVAACATAVICLLASRLSAYGIALIWIGVAAAIALAVAAVIVGPAIHAGSSVAREAARGVLTQMLPPLGIGAVVTTVIVVRHPAAVAFLPAVWLVLFGLGIAAIAPMVLARVEYAAIIYFVGAALAYLLRTDEPAYFALLVGVPFTLGHAITALLLRGALTLECGGNPNE